MLSGLRWIHRWIGILVAIPVAIQGLSGAILAFEPMLPALTHDATDAPPRSANDISAAARATVGEGSRVTRFTPGESGRAAVVQLVQPGSGSVVLRIDPVSLQPLDPGLSTSVLAWLRTLHVSFHAPEYGGRGIGGWFGIGLVLLLVTGVPIWWPRKGAWKDAVTFTVRARGVRFHRRLHGAFGAWAFLALLVLAGTGVALAFPRTTRGLLGLEAGGPPRSARTVARAAPAAAPAVDLDATLALARQAVPGGHVRSVILPARPDETVRVFMTHAGGEGARDAVSVQVDAATRTVIAVQDGRAAPGADRFYRWMHDLHEGMGLGPAWRGMTVLTGLALPVFAITGPVMWWLKRRLRRRAATATAPTPTPAPTPAQGAATTALATTGNQDGRNYARSAGE